MIIGFWKSVGFIGLGFRLLGTFFFEWMELWVFFESGASNLSKIQPKFAILTVSSTFFDRNSV
jgi:hypothetical protein